MTAPILVVLKRHHRLVDLLPYLATIARPGMRVVFLISHPINGWTWWQDHYVTGESTRAVMTAAQETLQKYSSKELRRLAERRIAPARQALSAMGVSVDVNVYGGTLGSELRSRARGGTSHLVIRRRGGGIATMFLRQLILAPRFTSGAFARRPDQSTAIGIRP